MFPDDLFLPSLDEISGCTPYAYPDVLLYVASIVCVVSYQRLRLETPPLPAARRSIYALAVLCCAGDKERVALRMREAQARVVETFVVVCVFVSFLL